MKTTRLRMFYCTLTIIVGLVFASGCGGKLAGQVFFDDNDNGQLDKNESGAAYVKLEVLHNGQKMTEGVSREDGSFQVRTNEGPGDYCIKVDTTTIQKIGVQSKGQVIELAGPEIKAFGLTVTTPSATDDEDNKCTDANNDGKCDNYVSGNDNDNDNDNTSNDNDNDNDNDNKNDNDNTSQTVRETPAQWTINGLCKKTKYWQSDIQFAVPLRVTYKPEEAERLPLTCYAGSECKVQVPSLVGCKLEPIELPDGLHYGSDVPAASQTLAGKGVVAKAAVTQTGLAPIYSVTTIEVETLNLVVDDDIPVGEKSVEVIPKITCPDGEHILAKAPIKLKREKNVTVHHSYQEMGDKFKVMVTIENKGQNKVEGMTLVVRFSPEIEVVSVDDGCHNLKSAMECTDISVDGVRQVLRVVTGKVEGAGGEHKVQTELTQAELELDVKAPDMVWTTPE